VIITKERLEDIARLPKPQQIAAIELVGRREWEACADDVMYWLDASQHYVPYVFTLDRRTMYKCITCNDDATYGSTELAKHMFIRHNVENVPDKDLRKMFTELPTTRSFTLYDYMRPIIKYWLNEQLLAFEKSRDMMATWLITALYTWDTIFHQGRQNIFQSEDSTKANELVERAGFIYDNQPKFLRRHKRQLTVGSSRSGIFKIPDMNSEILGFPQGPNQIRQYHPAGIFLDEAAFQAEAAEAFAAIKPAIQAGGRVTLLSTPNPSFFQAICQDKLEKPTD